MSAASERQGSHLEILKSSAMIGGSSAINLLVGLVRTKAMALLLGPAGIGLMGALNSILDLGRTIAEVGINNSGVRQIAESEATGDKRKVALTVLVLRRTVFVLASIGAVAMVLMAPWISNVTFGSAEFTVAVALLSLALLLRVIADGQGALLQGKRLIAQIAKVGIFGSVLGSTASVALVYAFGEKGVAPSIVAVAAGTLLISWLYARTIKLERPSLAAGEFREEAKGLLQMGLAFMLSAFLTMGAAYLVKLILIRQEGLEAAGLYQAAWAISGIFIAFILQSMGADFYPQLVAAANDHATCNRLVNEQTQVSLLLASTGVIATLVFAPLLIGILYSRSFLDATQVFRWICIGMALRVISWPLGYILIAKGRRVLFVVTDMTWAIANVLLTWWFVGRMGLVGAGIAFFLSYLLHVAIVYPMSRSLTGFKWTRENLVMTLAFLAAIAVVHWSTEHLGALVGTTIGASILVASAAYTLHSLRNLLEPSTLSRRLAWLGRKEKKR